MKNIRPSPLKSIQKMSPRLSESSTSGNGLTKKILDLQFQLAERENEYAEMRESNEFLTNENLVLEESRREYEEQVALLKGEKEKTERRVAELEQCLAELKSSSSVVNGMPCESDSKGRAEQLRRENIQLGQELAELRQQVIQSNFRCQSKDKMMEQLQSQVNLLKEERISLSKVLADLRVENSALISTHQEEVLRLNAQLAEKEDVNQKLIARYLKHRQVWEENQEKANFEIQKLDEVIDNVIATIRNNLEKIGNIPAIHLLLRQLTNEE